MSRFKSKSKAIAILGMHRSGTSAVARAINILGVYLGEEGDMARSKPDNPTGFWERDDVVVLHDHISNHFNRSWDSPLSLPHAWYLCEDAKPIKAELFALVKNIFSGHELWAWKDPRTCLVFDMWKDVINELGMEIACLFVVRNPLDVARSLEKRNNFPHDKSFGIWFNYNISALKASLDMPRVFISYDCFLADWETELKRCATGLDIEWPADDSKLTEQMDSFIRPGLRHSKSGVKELEEANAPRPVRELYGLIMDLLSGKIGEATLNEKVNGLADDFSAYERFFHDDMLGAWGTVAMEKDQQIDALLNSWSWRITAPLRRVFLFWKDFSDKVALMKTVIRFAQLGTDKDALIKTVIRFAPLGTGRRKIIEFAYHHIYRKFSSFGVKKRDFDVKLETNFSPLSFPLSNDPEVSIVIPVYNKFVYTYNCLKAVIKHTGDIRYEIIIVDNASTDETADITGIVKNITVIKNKENLGFVGACNEGARKAEGKYTLFLNNDTKVQEGWLAPMLEAVEKDCRVGAVGAKLIFPDGTLQEAGGILWNDEKSIAWNYGRDKDPYDYRFNYLKDVDYCSAACLLVRSELFERIGGFDSRYSPAYCEDTDLAFNVRQAGYRLVYQPGSEVVHFEGMTGGTDTSKGVKRYQEINTKKLYKKWKTILEAEHFRYRENIFLARDRSKFRKVLLFMDECLPTHDRDAGSLSTFMYLKLLVDMGIKVIFAPGIYYKQEPYTTELQQLGIEVMYGNINFKKWMRLNGKYLDYIWLSRPYLARRHIGTIKKYTSARVIYNMIDLHYLRTLREYELKKDRSLLKKAERFKKAEFQIFNQVDSVVTYSDREAEILKAELPDTEVTVVPLFIYDEIPAEKQAVPSFGERKNIVYLGGFNHPPNTDAVKYFIKDIFPLVRKKLPDVKIFIIGHNPPEEIKQLLSEDVIVTGYVKDLGEYFNKCRVLVAPLRFGAGVKGKILTSMSYGVPVVTTSIGNEGLNMKDRIDCMLTDDTKEFADRVIELYSDKKVWDKLSKNAVRFIKENFSGSNVARTVEGILGVKQ